jgi:REP element-mobilizing transposase RayT
MARTIFISSPGVVTTASRLDTTACRNLLLEILEEARRKYRFVVHGYVVMPEHVHLLMTEPEQGDPAVVMKVIKQGFARQVKEQERQTPHLRTTNFFVGRTAEAAVATRAYSLSDIYLGKNDAGVATLRVVLVAQAQLGRHSG